MTEHDVTVEDVLDRLPMATGNIGPDTSGLSTGQIERWIGAGARRVNAIVRRHGMDPTDLPDHDIGILRDGIVAYAQWQCLEARDYDDKAARAREEFNDVLDAIRAFPSEFDSDDAADRIRSSESDGEPKWSTDAFGGW